MTETQERFLRTILSRVEPGTVVELHLFPPIRRGTLETGVAVIATELPPAPLAIVEQTVAQDDAEIEGDLSQDAPASVMVDADAPDAAAAGAVDGVEGDGAAQGERAEDQPAEDFDIVAGLDESAGLVAASEAPAPGWAAEALHAVSAVAPEPLEGIHDATADDPDDADSPYRDEGGPVAAHETGTAGDAEETEGVSQGGAIEAPTHDLAEMTADPADGLVPEPAPAVEMPARRLRILTASYRHTIKGVDRGKWTVDVQVEADAPAEAIEAVLRGVRHRSTEPADPELIATEVLLHLVTPAAVAPAA